MVAGPSTELVFVATIFGLMVVSLLSILEVIQSSTVLGGGIVLGFITVSLYLVAKYHELTE